MTRAFSWEFVFNIVSCLSTLRLCFYNLISHAHVTQLLFDDQLQYVASTWAFLLRHFKTNFRPSLAVIYLPGRNCADNREQHNNCWLDAQSDYSCNLVIVKLNGIVPRHTIMGEYFDYRLQSPVYCPDQRFQNEKSAVSGTGWIKCNMEASVEAATVCTLFKIKGHCFVLFCLYLDLKVITTGLGHWMENKILSSRGPSVDVSKMHCIQSVINSNTLFQLCAIFEV